MRLKVCGVTTSADMRLLGTSGADLVGLWHGVPEGPHELSLEELEGLMAVAASAAVEPVLVTLASNPGAVADVVRRTRVRWVQLHAHQLPSSVRALHNELGSQRVTIIKLLQVGNDGHLDRRLVRAYERAGVDVFLLEPRPRDGRVGSTGMSVPPEAAAAACDALERPFLLAGAITADKAPNYAHIAGHPLCLGVDLSSGARDLAGRLQPQHIKAIRREWRMVGAAEQGHVLLR
jgi:phosphoribosylanthranilate isomerase